MFLLSAALLLGMQTSPEPVTVLISDGAECVRRINGEQLSDVQFEARARQWAAEKREVLLRGAANTPYRCVGSIIYLLQAAGVKRIGVVTAAAPENPQ